MTISVNFSTFDGFIDCTLTSRRQFIDLSFILIDVGSLYSCTKTL